MTHPDHLPIPHDLVAEVELKLRNMTKRQRRDAQLLNDRARDPYFTYLRRDQVKELQRMATAYALPTRQRTREARIKEVVAYFKDAPERVLVECSLAERPQSSRCMICGRELTDPASIQRGIGPECWQAVTTARG